MNTQPVLPEPDARERAQRLIALLEAVKGLGVLAASAGLLNLLHEDARRWAEDFIGHFGLNPGGRYPAELLQYAQLLQDTSLRLLFLLACTYAALRLTEAYGLWRRRAWGEWLGAASGAVYIPFELRHFLHRPSVVSAAVIVINAAIIVFLLLQLRRRRLNAGPRAG